MNCLSFRSCAPRTPPATIHYCPVAPPYAAAQSTAAAGRSDDLFMELDRRSLTSEEEGIIAARLALQRRMLAEYERRERMRKARLL